MSHEILRRSRARRDLEEIWSYVADDNESAADRMLERIDEILRMLRDRPLAGRQREELAPGLRSFPIRSYVVFYLPLANGIDLVRVLSAYLDIGPEDFDI